MLKAYLIAWVLTVMEFLQPSDKTPWAGTYETTAEAMVHVAVEAPFLQDQPRRTLAWMLSIGWHESRFNPHAKDAVGALCTFQVDRSNLRFLRTTEEVMLEDPRACTGAMSTMVSLSLKACKHRPRPHWLGQYTGGGDCSRGLQESSYRVHKGDWIFHHFPLMLN